MLFRSFTITLGNVTGATVADAVGVGTIDDNDGPTVTARAVIASVLEGTPPGAGGTLEFSLESSALSPQDVVVTYQVVGTGANAATSGTDFTASGLQTVTFPAGVAPVPQPIVVNIVPDSLLEPNETLTIDIVSVDDGFAGASDTGTILLDDYTSASLVVSPTSLNEGDVGTQTVNVTA